MTCYIVLISINFANERFSISKSWAICGLLTACYFFSCASNVCQFSAWDPPLSDQCKMQEVVPMVSVRWGRTCFIANLPARKFASQVAYYWNTPHTTFTLGAIQSLG